MFYNLIYLKLTICEGDSANIYGNFETEQGYYYDSILDTLDYYNLDVTALSFFHNTVNNQSIIINPGDSIYLEGSLSISKRYLHRQSYKFLGL